MTRHRALVAVLLLCAALGCEDEPTPDIPDPTPSSSATSPSETESSPTTPPTAETLTPEETVRAWVDAQNTALRNGDTTGLAALATQDCNDCREFIQSIEDVYSAGGHFEAGEWTLVRGSLEQQPSEGSAVFTCGIRIAAGTTVPEAGASPDSYPPESLLFKFGLSRVTEAWLISTIRIVQ